MLHLPRPAQVEDEYEAWVEVAKQLYQGREYRPAHSNRGRVCHPHRIAPLCAVLRPSAGRVMPAAAFKLLPVAHKYSMGQLLGWCIEAVKDAHLPVGQPAAANTAAAVLERPPSEPSLLQWLCLADSLRFDALTQACLAKQPSVILAIKPALASPEQRSLLQGLRPSTWMDVMAGMAAFSFERYIPQWAAPPFKASTVQ